MRDEDRDVKPYPTTKSKNPITILKTVIKAIEEEPLRYDQGNWLFHKSDIRGNWSDPLPGRFPSCGTIGCVAGWTCMVTGNREGDTWATALRVLGLTMVEARPLFSGGAICQMAGDRGLDNVDPGDRAYAALGIEHIKDFIMKQWGVRV